MEEEITRLSGTERSDNRVKLNDRKLAGVINVRENRVARARESAGLVLAGVNSDLVSGLGRPGFSVSESPHGRRTPFGP